MERTVIPLTFGELTIEVRKLGNDMAALIYGGERPHIGSTVLAVPRESLAGDGSPSCTSSVVNVVGHKDEEICRYVAERLCRMYGVVCVCTGGFHKDGMTRAEIGELFEALKNTNLQA